MALSYTIERTNVGVDYDGRYLTVVPPVFPSTEIKDHVQASWDAEKRCWKVPPYRVYLETICEMYPQIPVSSRAAILRSPLRKDTNVPMDRVPLIDDRAHPYQRETIRGLVNSDKPGELVGLSPGLGKTLVSLGAAEILGLQNVLIICPLSLLRNWREEGVKWLNKYIPTLHGESPTDKGWWIANYNTVVGRRHQDFMTNGPWDLIVIDESVLIKNRDTIRFKKIQELRQTAKRTWLLSGSPTTRYADDLWAQFHTIDPTAFRSYWRFTNRYCWVEQDVWGTQIVGTRQDRDLHRDFADIMTVKNQEEVLPDLPESIDIMLPIELTSEQAKAHDEMSSKFATELENGTEVKAEIVLSKLIRLQQITSNLINVGGEDISAKAEAVEELIESSQAPLPVLIWTQWVEGAKALQARLAKKFPDLRVALITGEGKYNDQLFVDYKAGDIDILICSLAVGKFGHTLVNTKSVIYYDKSWMADDYIQSKHRVIRIGLQHRPLIFTLKAERTVDELVEDNLSGKMIGIAKINAQDLAKLLRGLRGS